VSLKVELEDGTYEGKKVGTFYQHSGGWKTSDNGITMQWNLVDIVGLLANREFEAPEVLPTTLDGWAKAVVSQLGANFENHYAVDPNYATLPVVATNRTDFIGVTCGDVIRHICMFTGTFARADEETGFLAIEPVWNEGNKITLDNLNEYPVMAANQDLAAIFFTLNDSNKTQLVVSGNSASASQTISIVNPFIKDAENAFRVARNILSYYGGNVIDLVGRGDMAGEIGDVDTVWMNESSATTGRRIAQTFELQDGVLQNARSTLLQSTGFASFQSRQEFTESGTFVVPDGVTEIRLILVGRGERGTDGASGTYLTNGADGIDGRGGKVWNGVVSVQAGQSLAVEFDGDDVSVGAYTSANGLRYSYGFTDIESGKSYAREGVAAPAPNSGDGGMRGFGGAKAETVKEKVPVTTHYENGATLTELVEITRFVPAGKGTKGVAGASGVAVIYWDKVVSE
jgi:hypothetical protein